MPVARLVLQRSSSDGPFGTHHRPADVRPGSRPPAGPLLASLGARPASDRPGRGACSATRPCPPPGVAVVATPGHVFGNQTLVVNTSTGIWASSENIIAAECLTPEHSTMLGPARWSSRWQQAVVLHASTIETTADQYNSIILEKALVDRCQRNENLLPFFPSSELTGMWTNPGTHPTFSHGELTHQA